MQSFYLNSGLAGLYNLLNKKIIAFIAIIYFLVSAFFLFKYGVNTSGEAAKYIEDAHRILNGQSLRNGFSIFYIIYSLLVAFFINFHFSLQGVACLQILLSFFAGCSIYKIIFHLSGNIKISIITLILFLVCFPVQKWNFFLYTESLHTSLTVAGIYFLHCLITKHQTKKLPVLLIVLLLILFSRPVGMIFLISVFAVVFLYLVNMQKKIFIYFFASAVVIVAVLLLQSKFTFYFNPDSLRRMEVICQVPETNTSGNYKEFNSAGLSSFFQVIRNEIGIQKFLALGFKKLVSFFGLTRNFYSTSHNLILIVTGIVLYPLAIFGLFFFKKERTVYIKSFIAAYLLITSIGIFFTCDEWSNRFIAPVLPLVIILAGMGLYCVSLILKNNLRNNNN